MSNNLARCAFVVKKAEKYVMLMNYSDYKEGAEEFYQDFYKVDTALRMTGYIYEGEFADYKGYGFLDKCCIFISFAKIAIEDNVDISEIQKELKQIYESNVVEELKENLGDDFDKFYSDYLEVQQEYVKL